MAAPTNDAGDKLAAELHGETVRLLFLAARVFTIAEASEALGPRRQFERIGIRLTDLVTAIGGLAR